MLSLSRWLVVCAGVVLMASSFTPKAEAFFLRRRPVVVNYYDTTPVIPYVAPVIVEPVRPLIVTARSRVVVGLRTETYYNYSAVVPVIPACPTVIVPCCPEIILPGY
jgi:hypothetical protein